MRKVLLFVMGLGLVLSGCAGTVQTVGETAPEQVLSKGGEFSVYAYNDRHYVTGSAKSSQAFAEHHHLPYTKTILGAGPQGETVVFEVDKKDSAYVERLMETYQHTPFLITEKGDDYAVYKYNSRIYVIGNAQTRASFEKNHHLPYTKTLLGAGPAGETVIFEVDRKDPAFAEQLMKAYQG